MSEAKIKAAFTTKRLEVFLAIVEPNPDREYFICEKDVYLAYRTDDEVAYPVCVCTICRAFGQIQWDWVEWIETNEQHRRQGIAMELCQGIRKFRNGVDLEMTGASEAGDAFCDAWSEAIYGKE